MTQDSVADTEESLFTFGTQVQAGLDDHNYQIKTANFWKDKLNGYAHVEKSLQKISLGEGRIKKVDVEKPKKKRGPSKGTKKDGNSKILKKNLNKQRKFGSINKEILRKYKELQDGVMDNINENESEMKLLFDRENWDSMHGLLVNSLKNENDMIETNKEKIVNDYTDFRQTQKSPNENLTTENGVTDENDEELNERVRLTQFSWSYPKDLTVDDLGVLYDITTSGIELDHVDKDTGEKNVRYEDRNGSNDIIPGENDHDDHDHDIGDNNILDTNNDTNNNQNSGIFTLSQVLGENIQRNLETQNSDFECIVIDDSCESEYSENDDITFENIEQMKKDKELIDENGTQQFPIEIIDSSNMIEIPNSSDDDCNSLILENDLDIVNNIDKNEELIDKEVIEIENSSAFEDSDSEVLLKRYPENGTQPIIEIDNFENSNQSYNEKMIIPTSSPISSEDEGNREVEVEADTELFRHEYFGINNEVQLSNNRIISNSNNDDNDDLNTNENLGTTEDYLTAPSQITGSNTNNKVNIEERITYFKGWNVSKIKKQLSEWGIKNASKLGRKTLEEKLYNICGKIDNDKWEWGINRNKKEDIISFKGFENNDNNNINNDNNEDNQNQLDESKFNEQINNALKQEKEIYYDIIMYKPLNVNKAIRIINERIEFKENQIDRKYICNYLDKMGIIWTDVE